MASIEFFFDPGNRKGTGAAVQWRAVDRLGVIRRSAACPFAAGSVRNQPAAWAWRLIFAILLMTNWPIAVATAHEPQELTVPPSAKRQLDISYGPSSAAQKLDLYWPSTDEAKFPLVIALHGGGFEGGDKRYSELDPMLTALSHRYAVAAVNYRLSGEAKFPAAVLDVKAAIRYLRANAALLHLDATRFVVWGASAGGNLAAMMAATSGQTVFDDPELGNSTVSSDVQAAVDWYGPVDFKTIAAQYGKNDQKMTMMELFISHYLGGSSDMAPDLARAAAPSTYVTPALPPILIEHGDHDSLVPVDQSRQLASLVEQIAGRGRVKLVILKNAEHSDPAFDSDENLQRIFSFLDMALRKSASDAK